MNFNPNPSNLNLTSQDAGTFNQEAPYQQPAMPGVFASLPMTDFSIPPPPIIPYSPWALPPPINPPVRNRTKSEFSSHRRSTYSEKSSSSHRSPSRHIDNERRREDRSPHRHRPYNKHRDYDTSRRRRDDSNSHRDHRSYSTPRSSSTSQRKETSSREHRSESARPRSRESRSETPQTERERLLSKWRSNYCETTEDIAKKLEQLVEDEDKDYWIRSSPADLYYRRDDGNGEMIATPRLDALCTLFENELIKRGEMARASQPSFDTQPKRRKHRVCRHKCEYFSSPVFHVTFTDRNF